jgi:hypothetical protein
MSSTVDHDKEILYWEYYIWVAQFCWERVYIIKVKDAPLSFIPYQLCVDHDASCIRAVSSY